ncbi:MAG: ABC transporter permease, partial [Clostridia bacterium]|nr:ABC transporter permease [Clostridia bacterium]
MSGTKEYLPKNKKMRAMLEASGEQSGSGLYRDAWKRLQKDKAAMTGLILIGIFILLAIFGPMMPFWDYEAIESRRVVDGKTLLPPFAPSLTNPMGTDQLGRDILSRVVYGIRVSLLVGVVARGLTMVLGVTLGVVAACYGGWVDAVLMRLTDVFLAFPVMLLAMVITLVLGPSLFTVCVALVVVGWPDVTRLIRGQALHLKNKDYVRASKALGASNLWIILKQIVPNCLSLIIVSFSMGIPGAIMYESGLSFFGFGIRPPMPSLGNMIADARGYMTICPWYIVF